MTDLHEEIAKRILKSGNCLCVLAQGFGESLVISSMLTQFQARNLNIKPLVVVLNHESPEGTTVTGETSSDQREQLYAAGGVIRITSRVLLADFLSRRLDPALVNLVVLAKAHEVADTSNEAFIVRLFREGNGKNLFVALTDKPHSIGMAEFVRNFFVSDVVLVPRFHEIAQKALSDGGDFSVQIHDCPLTVRQREIQLAFEAICSASAAEINKATHLNVDPKSIIANKTELFALRAKLEPVWLKLSWNTRQIVSDLAVVRKLLVALVRYDPVSFLTQLIVQQQTSSKSSPWWLSEDAQRVVRVARDRVSVDAIEHPPLWSAITAIAKERAEIETKFFLICPDDAAMKQLTGFVTDGAERSLLESVLRVASVDLQSVREAIDGAAPGGLERPGHQFLVTGHLDQPDELFRSLTEFLPDVVVLTEPSLTALRCVEVFRARLGGKLQVHIVSTSESLVEPKFQQLIEREAKAFDDLIRAKPHLTFFSKDELFERKRRELAEVSTASTRQGGSKRARTVASMLRQTVLVDVRELRSALPFMLFKKGFEIAPSTLSIGDYVLSRDIAVERKSVTGNDLQGSLISGRLYKQLTNMTHAFAWPVVLLEFSTNRVFQLQATESATGEINPTSLIAQIAAIIIHFPSLRLIWSPTFSFTASVFARLKQGREQPRIDPATKEPVSANDPVNQAKSATTKRAIEFLKACPGVTAANLPLILKRVKSIKELVELDDAEIVATMGKRDGNVFLKFIKHRF